MQWKRNGMQSLKVTLLAVLWLSVVGRAEEGRWFGRQVAPKALVRTIAAEQFPEPRTAMLMMVESVAGLAAKAVNDGGGDEMVWVTTGNGDMERWCGQMLKSRPALELRGVFGPWDLVERYRKRGVIKGYILYRMDKSRGAINLPTSPDRSTP